MSRIVHKTQPEEIGAAFDKVVKNGNKLIHYNMFLMRWRDFDAYCNWLFHLLSDIEKETDISHYSNTQKRIYGYMAERLFNVWLNAYHRKDILEMPIIWFVDNPKGHKNVLLWKLRDKVWDVINRINVFSHSLSNIKDY